MREFRKEKDMARRLFTTLRLLALILGLTCWVGHTPAFAQDEHEDGGAALNDQSGDQNGPNDESTAADDEDDEDTEEENEFEDAEGELGENG
jgi:hypothetical protein